MVGFVIWIRHHWQPWVRVWLRSTMEVLPGSRNRWLLALGSWCSRWSRYVTLPRVKLETSNATYVFAIFICDAWREVDSNCSSSIFYCLLDICIFIVTASLSDFASVFWIAVVSLFCKTRLLSWVVYGHFETAKVFATLTSWFLRAFVIICKKNIYYHEACFAIYKSCFSLKQLSLLRLDFVREIYPIKYLNVVKLYVKDDCVQYPIVNHYVTYQCPFLCCWHCLW